MQFWTGEYVELMNYWRSFIESEESPQEVDQYLDRIHLKAYDEYGRWEIRQNFWAYLKLPTRMHTQLATQMLR